MHDKKLLIYIEFPIVVPEVGGDATDSASDN